MSFLSDIGGLASAVTGNPVWGAVGGLFGGDDVEGAPSAMESMPPEMKALYTKTANQIMTDMAALTAGDEQKLKEYQSYFNQYSKKITPQDIQNFAQKPTLSKVQNQVLGAMQNLSALGNKYYVSALDDIERFGDDYHVDVEAGRVGYDETSVKTWLKNKLGEKWTDAHDQVYKDLRNAAQRGGNTSYLPGTAMQTLKQVSNMQRYAEANQMVKDAIGVGLEELPKLMTKYVDDAKKLLRYNTGLSDEEIDKLTPSQLDTTVTQLQKGDIKATPNTERLLKDNKQLIDSEVQKALDAYQKQTGKTITGSTATNLKPFLARQGVQLVNFDAGEQATKEMAKYDFWAIKDGKPMKWSAKAGLWLDATNVPSLTNNAIYKLIADGIGNPEVAKIKQAATDKVVGELTAKYANPNSVNEFVQNNTKTLKDFQTKYDEYLVKMKEQAGGMPDFMKPTSIYEYPGDLTTKPSKDELQIQTDIREELANSKTYQDYSKMIESVKFDLLNKDFQTLKQLALKTGRSQSEVDTANVDQLYVWIKNSTDPDVAKWKQEFDMRVEAGIAPIMREMPPDVKAAYSSIQEIEKAIKQNPVDLTEFIEDFKRGRMPTENEEKYRSMLMDMAENGLGVDLESDIYNFATMDLKEQVKQQKAKIDQTMSSRGLGTSSALADQQRLADEELNRQLAKQALGAKVEATKLNQGAREYGITTGTGLEDTLANRYMKGTQSAVDATLAQNDLITENLERTKQRAAIESGIQQAGDVKKQQGRADLLAISDKQEARDMQNKQNIYNEWVRRLNARENKIAQGANTVSGTGVALTGMENQNAIQTWKAQQDATKNRNALLSDIFAGMYRPKSKTTTKKVSDSDLYDAEDAFLSEWETL